MSSYFVSHRQLVLSAASASLQLRAQSQSDTQTEATFTTGVKIVNTLATVRQKKGGPWLIPEHFYSTQIFEVIISVCFGPNCVMYTLAELPLI